MQSESGGVLTGTEGYAKYEVDGSRGEKKGLIYVYWRNPYYGVTHFRYQPVDLDIYPDCDFKAPAGGSVNDPGALSFSFEFGGLGSTSSGTDVIAPGDLLNLFFGPANIPGVAFLGLSGIIRDAVLYLHVNDHALSAPQPTPPPVFGDLGPKSLRPMIDAAPEQWVGHWGSPQVSLNITATGEEPPLFVTSADWTTAPPLSLSENFTPGAEGLLVAAAPLIHSAVQFHGYDDLLRPAFAKAARTVLKRATETPMSPVIAASAFKERVGYVAASIPASVVRAKAEILGKSIGNLFKDKGGVAYLSNNVALRLFSTFPQTGHQILYQRLHADGRPLSSVMLDPVLDIR
ncbi:MAG TPA: hypothetical protein VFC23_03240 [Thermoanaerobaculia bacterium]|nr:hypothetical protein [Thermoanaerobaculia bacterium]